MNTKPISSLLHHVPVLINEVLRFLAPAPGKIFIDATLGAGGHTEALLQALGGSGKVYGIEADERNLNIARRKLSSYQNVYFIRDNFENLEAIGRNIIAQEGRLDGVLFDLGLSSLHVDEGERGFSFQKEGPLDMRFDLRQGLTAANIINRFSERQLISIFKLYGEEPHAKLIAGRIVSARKRDPFTTTLQLADFIARTLPKQPKFRKNGRFRSQRHPSTRVFQSLRIAVNRELEVLNQGLLAALSLLSPAGRAVVISYHSLEDRIVKNIFRDAKKEGFIEVLTKKPVEPRAEEQHENLRSRSAKLRAAEKI